ncbi:peptide antibiotic resistance protein [Rhizobium leguminosarum]|uniref:peptide antibiotic resistance protein n=1 Tax=Rhizobium leguminosarum TaxID=384 RepID=UPI00036F74C0|nr:peptide antibiotic resistance protein [Rhizobium leguminosarum]ASS56158.1 peptide antibiotic resistance protein [Rhizobium leguminosarum bv. viciae]AVC51047.1 TPR repeat family protein [Rhizobium leguminosarum bv. viciae]MBB4326829.1 DNA-binding SARP family transcriptional activator/TolB-like protein [Rhizobium leguminosarum]MBB4338826.1 DNA-binding SARP family transcriptional activator/TolB-like protein [Rhizobium leguminosarum]MBB4351881.1 DNA-binding SARP family transcriptional activator
MLHLQTFGDLRLIETNGDPVRYPIKGLLMMAHLYAGASHELSRYELAQFLWNDVEADLARLNLRKLLSRIRETDGGRAEMPFDFTATTVRLNTQVVSSDLDIFRAGGSPLERLNAIAELTQRGFIGNIKPATKLIDAWIRAQRDAQALQLRQALLDALPDAQKPGATRTISSAALQILERDPKDEQVRALLHRLSGGSSLNERLPNGDDHARVQVKRSEAGETPADIERISPMPLILPRLVLLPPTSKHADAGLALANALIEDVTIELCALRNISIVAPHTAGQIRRDSEKAAVVARHSIAYLLDTKLSEEGLFAQLVYFPTDEIIWANRFAMTPHILPRQRRLIAQQLTMSVARELAENEEERLRFEANPEAYHAYLVGSSLMSKLTLPHIRRARKAFKQSLSHKADFSPSFTGLARTFTSEWLVTAQGNNELLHLAEQNALRAIERDPASAAGHRELGVTKLYLGDVDASVAALHLAEELSPHFADVIYSHADTLVHASRPGDALAKIKKAISLNPIAPDAYLWCAAGASFFLEQYEEAIAYVEAMKDKAPAHRIAAASCAMIGDRKRALFHRQRAESINPVFDVEKWLAIVPFKEHWQKELYREGLLKAGF